jgi:serine/threonine protein kinase
MRCPFCRAENDESADVCFQCGRGLFALTQGHVVASRYEILSTLGQGGMGTVYKAHDRELDEFVALKVLRGDFTRHPEIAKRFRSEIKLARRIRHKNVCGIHEYGQEGHLRYIAMEFISGVDLRRVLRDRGALSPEDAFDVSIQIAEGLQAIHDEGIVHRDLKTPNIMRDSRGAVRLMDFGIAKQWESESSTNLTAAGHIVGTPEYMSPEQVRGEKIDSRSDIYALGIVIFELFTGQVPFRGDTPMLTLFRHLHDPPPLEGPLASRLPKALIPVLRKTLAKEAADRYPTSRELGEGLREAQRASAPLHAFLPRPIRSAAAPEVQPEPALALTPVPTNVPTEVPTLAPKAVSAPTEATPKAAHAQRVAARPVQPTATVAMTQEPGIPPAPKDPAEPPIPVQAATRAPLAPTAVPQPPAAPEVERPTPRTLPRGSRPVAAARRNWLPATLTIGAVLAVGAATVLMRQRNPPEGGTSTPVETPTTPVPAPRLDAQSPSGAGGTQPGSPSASPIVALPEPVATPDRAPKPSPSPVVARPPEPVARGTPAARTEGPKMSITRLPPGAAPSALATPTPRLEAAPTRTAPAPTGPETVELPSPTIASPLATNPTPSTQIGAVAPSSALLSPAPQAPGNLVLKVKPWAEVTIDGRVIGRVLPPRISLSPGPHIVILSHPDFEPFKRIVTIRAGEASALTVDLKDEAVRRKH